MKVPLSFPDIGPEEHELVSRVLDSGILSIGPMVEKFERMVAGYLGVGDAVAVSNGTAGLHLAVSALEIGEGDEVITTPFSFVASSNCILYARARPVFADIETETLNIDPAQVESLITTKTKAILPVHVFGHPADMDALTGIATKHGLAVIEDACEAIGALYKGKKAGTMGNAGIFAFYPNKQITTGEGGIIATNNRKLAGLLRSMRNQGRSVNNLWLHHERLGYNYRLDELSAALGVAQVRKLDEILDRREAVARYYHSKLSGLKGVIPPKVLPGVRVSWFVYVIRLEQGINRDRVMRYLQDNGIDCRPYFTPIHLQPFYRRLFHYREGCYPNTERASSSTLALPFFNRITEQQIDYVCQVLGEALSKE